MHRHGTQSCWKCLAGIPFYFPTEGSFTVSQPTATPSDSARPPAISGLDGYRQNLLTGGVSEDTANLLRSHSWQKGTAGAYNSAWKQCSSWCGQRKVDPFCSTMASIAHYLTELFKKGRSYHTVNVHRSAISAFHRPIDGVKVPISSKFLFSYLILYLTQ